jgi:hypothetical protein
MLDRVLTVVRPEENKDYIDKFNKLIQTSSVTYERVKELLEKKSILGFLTKHDIKGYEDVLSFERLEKLEPSELVANHLAGRYGLGIGTKDNNLEILQLQHPKCYFALPLSSTDEEYRWIEISKEFRVETHKLLPSRSKSRFKSLKA